MALTGGLTKIQKKRQHGLMKIVEGSCKACAAVSAELPAAVQVPVPYQWLSTSLDCSSLRNALR